MNNPVRWAGGRGGALAILLTTTALVAGCAVTGPTPAVTGSAAGRGVPHGPDPRSRGLAVSVEPAVGEGPLLALVRDATRTVDANLYELDDPTVEHTLTNRAAHGIRIRVLLDRSREQVRNRPAFALLAAGGVAVAWAPSERTDHAKYACADGDRCLILTGNPVAADEATTRDFVVTDTRPADVAAIEAAFAADVGGRPHPPGPGSGDLVWAPGARTRLLALIDGATRTLLVENEEMASAAVRSALVDAAGRGVRVTVVMTCDAGRRAPLRSLVRAGVSVRCPTGPAALFIHAKAMVTDDRTAYVGSVNFSTASMDYNRELGVVTADPAVVGPVAAVLLRDATSAPSLARSSASGLVPDP